VAVRDIDGRLPVNGVIAETTTQSCAALAATSAEANAVTQGGSVVDSFDERLPSGWRRLPKPLVALVGA
jgi:hypothetical protein